MNPDQKEQSDLGPFVCNMGYIRKYADEEQMTKVTGWLRVKMIHMIQGFSTILQSSMTGSETLSLAKEEHHQLRKGFEVMS